MPRSCCSSAMPFMKVDHDDRSAAGRLPDAMDPGFHGARTHWIRGFMAFRRARETYWIRGFMAFLRAPSARLALAPDDPADVLVGGDDPPARRGVRPARLGRLSG